MGISGGLSQAPMFAAAGTLAPERATTGSAVLNMTRQIGSALGVALLVALTATSDGTAGFKHAWAVQAGAGAAAAASLFLLRPRTSSEASRGPDRGRPVHPGRPVRAGRGSRPWGDARR
jgi:hypothetical protein